MQLYRTYRNLEESLELQEILKDATIPYEVLENSYTVDVTMTGNMPSNIQIILPADQFVRVNELYDLHLKKLLTQVDKEHYLFSFSEDELIDVVRNKEEWSEFDWLLAQYILDERDLTLSEEKLNQIETARIAQLRVGQKSSLLELVLGYVAAFFGGILGILIGWILWQSKKNLPNGERIFLYRISDRMHGRTIFIIGIIIFLGFYFLSFSLDPQLI